MHNLYIYHMSRNFRRRPWRHQYQNFWFKDLESYKLKYKISHFFCVFTWYSYSACTLLKNQSYTDLYDWELVKPNPPTNEECAWECKQRRKDDFNINGMTWNVNTRECRCTIGMKGKIQKEGSDICYFGKFLFIYQSHWSNYF